MKNLDKKIPVGVLGATGMVGQNYLRLLENHPWFETAYLAASSGSAGKTYETAISGRWQMSGPMPEKIKNLVVHDINSIESVAYQCRIVFSAFELGDKEAVKTLENQYAAAGLAVLSNSSAHRATFDVPVLIPEINPHHLEIIPLQQKHRGWERGFIVVKPNCSLQSYLLPVYALMRAGFEIRSLIVATMQAASGAGYPGVPSLDMIDNIIPFISGEEEKTEMEPQKILGHIREEVFVPFDKIKISAHCNRVPVRDGHLACVSLLFGDKKANIDEITRIWQDFRALPQELELPSAPARPIIYCPENDRPQPQKDRDREGAMAVILGRLRSCPVFDYKFIGLSHNTVRGAAGGGILNAELLVKLGYIK